MSSLKALIPKLSPKSWLRKKPPSDNHPSPSFTNATSIGVDDDDDEIKQVFNHLDENGDGEISPDELRRWSKRVGGSDSELSIEEAEMAVRSSDADGDGALGLEDFTKLLESGGGEDELRGVFQMYATEDTGCITPKSLKKMLSRLSAMTTVENCKTMISKFDLNGDGVISFDEFRVMMTPKSLKKMLSRLWAKPDKI